MSNSPAQSPPGRDSYKIGWICALSLELAAAMAVLDEEYPPLPRFSSDTNSYTLGRIGSHNVVITCLPAGQMGTTPAATIATHMQRTFQHIEVGLMVGIGGGVPSAGDIRLGDVVISKPNAKNGGIVQYDFGKHLKDSEYRPTGSLNAPPWLLLNALSKMQANHQILQYIENSKAAILQNPSEQFQYPGEENDELFEASYEHGKEETCLKCDRSKLIKRSSRKQRGTVIHYGTVASGNSVIKSGLMRDFLAKSQEVKCFEMEAAGINAFPYLVIRGICDYCDSHKNKRWQEYAALCAAICAKALLNLVAPEQDTIIHYQSHIQTFSKTSFTNELSATIDESVKDEPGSTMPNPESDDMNEYVAIPPQNLEWDTQQSTTNAQDANQEAIIALGRYILAPRKINEQRLPRTIYTDRKVVDFIKDWFNAPTSRILRIAGTTENTYPSSTSLISARLSKSLEENDRSHILIRCNGTKSQPVQSLISLVYSLITYFLKNCDENIDITSKCLELDGTTNTIGNSLLLLSKLLKSKQDLIILIDGIERIQGNSEVTCYIDEFMILLKESSDFKENKLKILFTTAGPCHSFQKFCRSALVTVDVDKKKTGGKPELGTSAVPSLG